MLIYPHILLALLDNIHQNCYITLRTVVCCLKNKIKMKSSIFILFLVFITPMLINCSEESSGEKEITFHENPRRVWSGDEMSWMLQKINLVEKLLEEKDGLDPNIDTKRITELDSLIKVHDDSFYIFQHYY